MKPWKKISQKSVFTTPWFEISQHTVELPNQEIYDDYFINTSPDVVIMFATTNENKVILIKEYKYGADQIITTLPAGCVEPNEKDYKDATLRELEEETGYIPETIEKIDDFLVNPTSSPLTLHLYRCYNCKKVSKQNLDQTEEIEVLEVTKDELDSLIQKKEIKNSGALMAIYHILYNQLYK